MRKITFLKIAPFLSVGTFLLLWQVLAVTETINPSFTGTPSLIFTEGWEMVRGGEFVGYLLFSLKTLFLGFLLALTLGISLGMIIGSAKKAGAILHPYIYGLYVTPLIALMPLVILWFGIGFIPTVIVVFLMSFAPILVNVSDGVKEVDQKLVSMAKSFEASKWFIFENIIFYSLLPFIVSGMKVAFGRAVIGMVVAEFFGLGRGLGYLISFYGGTFQINKLMFLVLLLILLNLAVIYLIEMINKKLVLKWK